MKRIIVSVTNDLVTDQRVDRVCNSLVNMGFEVLLVGRKQRNSLPLHKRAYKMYRMRLIFGKGPCFYAEYNIRLFCFLVFRRASIFLSNDLDTLLANFLASKICGKDLVYDTHEYYTETPELVSRKRVQRIWERIEGWIFPKLKIVYTVNDSIAGLYHEKYGTDVKVIMNLPYRQEYKNESTRAELGLPENKKIILLQGAGINIQRGIEEMIDAMKYIDDAVFVIIGGGDVIEQLEDQVKTMRLGDRVMFVPKMPFNELYRYSVHADLAVTLDKDTNINYRYSLPNKLFDYIQARIPVLASNLFEIRKVIEEYEVGRIIHSHDPQQLASVAREMLEDPAQYEKWKEKLRFASEQLCWENEEKKLTQIYAHLAG